MGNSRTKQDFVPALALGGQHQRRRVKPKTHGSKVGLTAALSQQAQDFRGRFFDRAARNINARPVVTNT